MYTAPKGETTEWDDIQRKLGNLPPLVSLSSMVTAWSCAHSESVWVPTGCWRVALKRDTDALLHAGHAFAVPLPVPSVATQESEKEAEEDAPDVPTIDPYDLATAAELDELEEDEEFADTRFLDDYRQKRIAEMKEKAKTEKFGTVQNLVRADFVREVSDASKECWVVVHLHQDYVEKSNTLAQHLRLLAPKHKATKFLQIEADQCIEGYPDK